MAQATVIRGGKMKVKLGDGASPETFTAPCGFNSKSLTITRNTSESVIPDCSDEDAPAWVGTDVISMGWTINGEGLLTKEARDVWKAIRASLDPVNVRIEIEWDDETEVFTGRAHLTNFETTGPRGEKVTANINLVGDGALLETTE